MDNWRIIKDKHSYELAMNRLLELADCELVEGSSELDEFELLSLLIGHYEDSHFKIDKPNPIEAIKFRMDQAGLNQADMKQYLGSASKVSEVLSGKRKLSLSMIRRLHDGLGIPADILIQDSASIEWSPVTYGAEVFAIAFSDSCGNTTESLDFVEKRPLGNEVKIRAKKISFDVLSHVQAGSTQAPGFIACS